MVQQYFELFVVEIELEQVERKEARKHSLAWSFAEFGLETL